MKTLNIHQWILACVALLFFTSCGGMIVSAAKKEMTIEKGDIPPDFGKDDAVILCVLADKKGYDKYMKKQVSENYFGKYEFVYTDNVNSSKYNNVSKFRY